MNERIKELKQKSYVTIYGEACFDDGDVDILDVNILAQSIIRECRDIVGKTRDRAIEDGWNVDEAMSTAMFDIEAHFGVKDEV